MVTFEKEVEGSSERAVALFLGKARKAARLSGGVDVLVTTNRRMRDLNRQFRRKDKPTDVLSFPADVVPGNRLAGGIAISADIAAQNGKSFKHGAAVELKILVLHGVLHLAGHDHETDSGEMARKERKLRRELGLPDGLIERASSEIAPAKSRSHRSADARSASATRGVTPHKRRQKTQDTSGRQEKRQAARSGR